MLVLVLVLVLVLSARARMRFGTPQEFPIPIRFARRLSEHCHDAP